MEKFRDLRNGNGDKFVLTLPTVDAPEVIKGRRFLVVLCESKLVLLDTDSRKRRDAPAKQFFDGATLTTMSFLFRTSQANVLHIAGMLVICTSWLRVCMYVYSQRLKTHFPIHKKQWDARMAQCASSTPPPGVST